ncbi:helix-turn-helix domain-containing protein, partial [Acinetobacter stercoris]|uniref:helix-turn-helix domain-containing protein n=1 Tax=Acinetobacter stercoris TaxID=2126983 RepID=UPI0011B26561
NIIFSKIEFTQSKPNNTELFEKFFRCPLFFNAKTNRIYLDKANCETKINKQDPVLLEILKKQADRLILTIPATDSFSELLNENIIYSINRNRTNIEYVAERIGIPTRLLQYQLKRNGINYSKRLTDVRKELALQYLKNEELSILDISILLAYKEQASFNRAFKSWTGMSPSQWRKEIENQCAGQAV